MAYGTALHSTHRSFASVAEVRAGEFSPDSITARFNRGSIMLLELCEFCRGFTRKQTERGKRDNCNYGVTHSGVQCPQLPEGDRNRLEKGRPTIRLDTTLFLCALVL